MPGNEERRLNILFKNKAGAGSMGDRKAVRMNRLVDRLRSALENERREKGRAKKK
jgi:hypothetical protein